MIATKFVIHVIVRIQNFQTCLFILYFSFFIFRIFVVFILIINMLNEILENTENIKSDIKKKWIESTAYMARAFGRVGLTISNCRS